MRTSSTQAGGGARERETETITTRPRILPLSGVAMMSFVTGFPSAIRRPDDLMRLGTGALQAAAVRTQFFLLPDAEHRSFGPQGNEIVRTALQWVAEAPPSGDEARAR